MNSFSCWNRYPHAQGLLYSLAFPALSPSRYGLTWNLRGHTREGQWAHSTLFPRQDLLDTTWERGGGRQVPQRARRPGGAA